MMQPTDIPPSICGRSDYPTKIVSTPPATLWLNRLASRLARHTTTPIGALRARVRCIESDFQQLLEARQVARLSGEPVGGPLVRLVWLFTPISVLPHRSAGRKYSVIIGAESFSEVHLSPSWHFAIRVCNTLNLALRYHIGQWPNRQLEKLIPRQLAARYSGRLCFVRTTLIPRNTGAGISYAHKHCRSETSIRKRHRLSELA